MAKTNGSFKFSQFLQIEGLKPFLKNEAVGKNCYYCIPV